MRHEGSDRRTDSHKRARSNLRRRHATAVRAHTATGERFLCQSDGRVRDGVRHVREEGSPEGLLLQRLGHELRVLLLQIGDRAEGRSSRTLVNERLRAREGACACARACLCVLRAERVPSACVPSPARCFGRMVGARGRGGRRASVGGLWVGGERVGGPRRRAAGRGRRAALQARVRAARRSCAQPALRLLSSWRRSARPSSS